MTQQCSTMQIFLSFLIADVNHMQMNWMSFQCFECWLDIRKDTQPEEATEASHSAVLRGFLREMDLCGPGLFRV